jgi:hypothetical protein
MGRPEKDQIPAGLEWRERMEQRMEVVGQRMEQRMESSESQNPVQSMDFEAARAAPAVVAG